MKEKNYPQVSEFNAKGNPLHDIDFSDHDNPKKHLNRHQYMRASKATCGATEKD